MRLTIDKVPFLKSWQLAERNVGTSSAVNTLTGVLCTAEENHITLQATDLKTCLTCNAQGITVERNGSAVFPVKVVGDIFKKIPAKQFTVEVSEGSALITAGRNKYRFGTYRVEEFPRIPSSATGEYYCDLSCGELLRVLGEGSISGSVNDEFPQYLSGASLQLEEGRLTVAATDTRRLSLSRTMVREGTQGAQLVLPIRGLRELGRVLSSCESEDPVRILVDGAQAFFQFPGGEFSVRRIDTKFPAYEKFLAKDRTTWMVMDKDALLAAVERMDLIVRDFTRMVVLQLSPAGNLHISAQAPEVGDAMEELDAEIDGEPLRIAFNVRFLLDGLKAVSGTLVHLSFNGSVGQMTMSRPDDDAFLYVAMPIALSEEDAFSEENAL